MPSVACDHVVQLYDSEEVLADTVAGVLASALRQGEGAVAIATEQHRRAFARALTARGVDTGQAITRGWLVMLDAAATLRTFMTPAGPDAERFAASIGPVLDGLAAGKRSVHAYGEMVALLWRDGDVASAMRLEELWNGLAEQRVFSLLCAYPRDLFSHPDAAADLERMCAQHARVLPTDIRDAATRVGRRTLGLCAHCGRPVAYDEHYVRLYRRAWHVECALESGR